MKNLIISFYTNDWEYPEHATRLKNECKSFKLPNYIIEQKSTTDYIKNTAIKPFFIKDALLKFRRPVVWIDVDALLLKPIDIDFADYDLVACKHTTPSLNREWAVSTLGFNFTKESIAFLTEWCNLTTSGTDESSFELAWQKMKDTVKVLSLPNKYTFVKWSNKLVVPEDTIVCHQLSKFEDKMRRKNKGISDES
jgi:hypothetical protein